MQILVQSHVPHVGGMQKDAAPHALAISGARTSADSAVNTSGVFTAYGTSITASYKAPTVPFVMHAPHEPQARLSATVPYTTNKS